MKAEAKRRYLDALVEHAQRKTRGATEPVVVQAYRFFDEACARNDLPHPFMPGNVRQILDQFTDGFVSSCFSGDGEGFPIQVMKMAKAVGLLCGHGRQAVMDAERTPERYRTAATISGSNGLECWALFGPDANRHHPMIKAGIETERKRLKTSVSRFNQRTKWIEDDTVKIDVSDQKLLAS